jgi:uncharacterized membrane protein
MTFSADEIRAFAEGIRMVIATQPSRDRNKVAIFLALVVQSHAAKVNLLNINLFLECALNNKDFVYCRLFKLNVI